MKRISAILVALAILLSAGCASTGGGGGGGGAAPEEPYVVDLGNVKILSIVQDKVGPPTGDTVKNSKPFAKNYDDLLVALGDLPDVTGYSRIKVVVNCYDANGNLISPKDGNAMASVIEDLNGDLRGGGGEGTYKNIPLKTYNLGGFSSSISGERGQRLKLTVNPQAVLIQNSSANVAFIEVTEISFHP